MSQLLRLPTHYDLVVGDTFELFFKGITYCLNSDVYDYTVAYADKILTHWHEAGVRTVGEAEALLAREKESKRRPPARETKKKPSGPSSFEVGDFFQKAIERSYRNDKK